jgi:GDPmannose 4,6-dehydratase
MKISLITGITGQDGSYLAELLLEKNYIVYGIIRRSSTINTERIEHIRHKLKLHYGDITDKSCIVSILNLIQKENDNIEILEIYNLAAQSHVKISFELPEYTTQVDANGTLNILESIRHSDIKNVCRFYQASSSEMFGKVLEIPQTEKTPFYPRSPYGVAKVFGYWIIKNYREAYGLYACNGILFNHESPRRGFNFVTRKITIGIASIIKNKSEYITLGNIDSKRDWGHAKDYVESMWLMLQQNEPDDYVIATGKNHTIREFIEKSFKIVNINIKWKGQDVNEVGYDENTGKILIKIDQKFFRPTEVDELLGDSSYARKKLGWKPKISFEQLINEMVECDIINS